MMNFNNNLARQTSFLLVVVIFFPTTYSKFGQNKLGVRTGYKTSLPQNQNHTIRQTLKVYFTFLH